MVSVNQIIPDTFMKLYNRLKIEGGRVNQSILLDLGVIHFQKRHLEMVQNDPTSNARMIAYMNENLKSFISPCFKNFTLIEPKIGLGKQRFHYRDLLISIFKSVHVYIQQFNNEDTSFLIESRQYDLSPASRIGIFYGHLLNMHPKLVLRIRGMVGMVISVLDKLCMNLYNEYTLYDRIYFTVLYVKEGMVIWCTVGPRDIVEKYPKPCNGELFNIMGFPL